MSQSIVFLLDVKDSLWNGSVGVGGSGGEGIKGINRKNGVSKNTM